MCGIIGYVGEQEAAPVIIDGLRRLEYRGYDSVGIAILDDAGTLSVRKREGKLSGLTTLLEEGGRAVSRYWAHSLGNWRPSI
jgi:glucosamine--fructose-6-phosphate aminotransferase (isomerizing)